MSTKKAVKSSSRKAAKKAPSKSAKKAGRKIAPKAAKKAAPKKPDSKAANSASSGMSGIGKFNWNELMTSDENAATQFYTQLFGWKAKPFGMGMDYTILENNGIGAAGLMKTPEGGPPPMWLAYVTVKDINASVARLTQLGGQVCKGPFPIPDVGQIAIVRDPQGAMFGLHAC